NIKMLNGEMHIGIPNVIQITVEIMGAYAYFCPETVSMFVSEYVTDYCNPSVDFYEFEKGHGYFFPSSQRKFNVLNPREETVYTVDADEFGIAITLYTYDCIIHADTSELSPDNLAKSKSDLVKIKQLRDYLYNYAMQNFNSGNLKYITQG
ncbi:antirestriction protein, partial [Citrobacter freundii]